MGQQGGGNNTLKWVIGCGVGCLVLCIIAAIVVGVGGYLMATKGMTAMTKEFANQAKNEYAQLKADNKVPAEHTATFDEIYAVTQNESASTWAVMIATMAIAGPLEDGQVSEEEAKQIQTVRDFVVANPQCSMMDMTKFFEAHPELSQMRTSMPTGPNSYPGTPPTPPTRPDTSAAPAEPPPPPETPAPAEAPANGA